MTKIISSKSAKVAAGVIGLIAGFAMLATSASAYTFSTNLKVGSTGADVKNLQMVLNMSADTKVDGTGAGSAGKETSYFGPATKSAVIRFQEKYASDILSPVGLTAGTGFVGASTRAHLNTTTGGSTTGMVPGCSSLVGFSGTTGQSCATGAVTTSIPAGCTSTVGFSSTTGTSCSTGGSTVVTSGPVSASLANDNPSASAVVAGQATADLMHIAFTGNGTITNVKLQRTGISANSTLSNVYLFQGNVRVADGTAVNNTDGTITFNNLNIAVNGQTTISVKSDIAAGTAGQVVGVALIGYTTSGNAMTSANISGNYMNVAGTTGMATVTLSGTQATSSSVNAGTAGYTLWSQSVAVTNRSVLLKGATFKYIGSAPTDALANARLYVNGTAVGPVGTINSSNNLSFDFGSTPVTLVTGSSIVEVRADIVKGSSRNIKLSLQNAADVMVMDTQLGINVALSSFAISDGGTMTISSGTITTTIDPAFNSVTNVTGGATGATIASFKLQAYGEDVKVSSLTVTPTLATTSIQANGLNNVGLFYDGAQVGSSQNVVGSSTALTFQLGSALIVSAGSTGHILEVRADIQSAASLNYTSGTITVLLSAGSSNGQGMNSYTTSNVPASNITSAALTINTGALSVGKSAAYAASQTVNPNTANVKIGSYVIQNTSSSESVRITNLAVALSFATTTITNVSNLRTSETSGSGSTPINPVASNNFSVNFTLAPGQSKTIDVMGDLGSDTSGTITSTLLPTAIGASSNVTLTPSSATGGQTLTLAAGSLATPTLNPAPGSLAAQFVVGNTSPALAQYNFIATNGTATITELRFTTGGTAGTSSITQVSVGGQTAPVVNGVAQVTNLNIVVPAGTAGLNVTVTPTFASVGVNGLTSNTTATTSLTYMKYTIGGVTTSTSTIAVPSNTMTLVGTKPSLAIAASTDTLSNSTIKVAEVTVTADTAGDLKLNSLPISVTSTGAVNIASATDNIIVRDTSGNLVTTTNITFAVGTGATGTSTIAFTNGYLITAGTSKTFRIYVTPQGVIASNSLSTKLGASALLLWKDQVGGVDNITGANIYNYPTDTVVTKNY